MKKRILFMGTPEIAKEALLTLLEIKDLEIVGVVSQPDRNFDRKKNIIFSPVKQTCIKKNIIIYQPEKISEIYDDLNKLNLDAIITCAYGQFIPEKIILIPKYGTFNFHGSLLPKLRGGAPIHWAIINNEKITGWTLMKTIKEMDAGDYCSQYKINIDKNENTSSLYKKMTSVLKKFIVENIMMLFDKNTLWIKQDHSKATFAYNIQKKDKIIDFNKNANLVNSQIRGLLNTPTPIWKINNLEIKIFDSKISNLKSKTKPGEINKITKEGIFVSTNDFDVIFSIIQIPNKSKINISEVYKNESFLRLFK